MEARRKARTMRRAASRSAAKGKARARSMGRAKRGGDDDLEMGLPEQHKQNIMAMEEGRSPSPPINYTTPKVSLSAMEKGFGPKKMSNTIKAPPKVSLSDMEKGFGPNKMSNTIKVGGKRKKSNNKGNESKTKKYKKGNKQTKKQGKSKSLFEQLFGL